MMVITIVVTAIAIAMICGACGDLMTTMTSASVDEDENEGDGHPTFLKHCH